MTDRYKVVNHDTGEENGFDDEDRAENTRDLLAEDGDDVQVIDTQSEGEAVEPEIVDHGPDDREGTPVEPTETAVDAPENDDTTAFLDNPIEYLESINNAFVNTIKGKPAISKRGFRYIQSDMGISTTAEVVETFADPVGIVVHARAELPNGRHAEAHGEGYLTESDVDDNEFVRYADTRAKNRALSDLTSSGALAESEL
jgi:hypothetical protein